ncbi:MAG: hypothetical protein NZM12_06745, partial [Steroidobacteraceae bacterium]|nr:hypothetical protein [Steroidobacteraceae bacterium]MDW8260782.1 proton-conducting transporter membrane subunit [Gammaproteobacteria bacterium]
MLFLLIAFPLVAATALPLLARRSRRAAVLGAAIALLASAALLISAMPAVLGGATIDMRVAWVPQLGLQLSLRLDGLGLLFALLVLGVGLLVVLYAAYYLPAQDRLGRFYALLLIFAASMLGIVLAENLIVLLIFWELTSLASFLLIAYKREAHEARIAARMALAVTGAGGLALL